MAVLMSNLSASGLMAFDGIRNQRKPPSPAKYSGIPIPHYTTPMRRLQPGFEKNDYVFVILFPANEPKFFIFFAFFQKNPQFRQLEPQKSASVAFFGEIYTTFFGRSF